MNPFDAQVRRLAAAQYGVFSRSQLMALGATPAMIKHRLSAQRWESVHPTVYALAGTPASWHRDQMAACLWAGGAAGVGAAAHLHDMPGFGPGRIEVVTTLNKRPMPRCGVVVHHTKRLPRDQIVTVTGIPTTSVERTLMDLCGHVSARRASIALDQSLHAGKTTLGCLDHCLFLTARRGRDGCAVLRNFIKERAGLNEYPNSPLETVIFELLATSGLPLPALQMNIYDERGRFVARPDFVWPEQKVIVEGHSKLWHQTLEGERRDKERHEPLVRSGHRILYVTWADAITYGDATLKRVERELEGASSQAAA